MGDAELAAAELDALAAVFEGVTVVSRWPPVVSIAVAPRGAPEAATFVAATLTLACGTSYPASPPAVSLTDVKGMGAAREAALLARLAGVAGGAAGDAALAVVADAALDALTDDPGPSGDCPMCLDPLKGGGRALVRLACWHGIHLECAAAWWAAAGRRGGGAGAGDASLTCPTCRAVAGPLAPAAVAKLEAVAAKAKGGRGESPPPPAAEWGLDADAAASLAAHQASVAAGLARQAAAGGSVDARYAVALEGLAASGAAAAVGAAAPPAPTESQPLPPPPDKPARGPRRRAGGRGRGRRAG